MYAYVLLYVLCTRSSAGDDAMDMFLMELEAEEERIRHDLSQPAAMSLTAAQEQEFLSASSCWICGKTLHSDRVRDHDHVSGNFRGAAHQA